MKTRSGFGLVLASAVLLAGCRGMPSEKPPLHPNPNMDNQAKLDPQSEWDFFEDGRAMRPQVPGTVAVGSLRDDEHLHGGRVDGEYAEELPAQLPLTNQLVSRGQERFDIFCTPCHDSAGTGQGTVALRGMQPVPPTFHDDRLRAMPIGQFYDIVANGVRNMPGYAAQISVEDRWAIAVYVRALQLSQSAPLEAVPEDIRQEKSWGQEQGQ